MTLRDVTARASVVGLSLLALCLGLALGSTACGCECPEAESITPDSYAIVESDGRPELVGGTVDVQPESVTITYTLDGVDWTVEYMTTE